MPDAAHSLQPLSPLSIGVGNFGPYIAKFPYDPTYGYALEELLRLAFNEPAPADFDAFWTSAHARNEQLELAYEFKPSVFRSSTHEVRELYFNSLGDFRVGGWLTAPKNQANLQRVEVWGHGYGGRESPEAVHCTEKAAQFWVTAPGFNLSRCVERLPVNHGGLHVLSGIHSRETYSHLFSAAAYWSAARLMEELYPGLPIVYRGSSFGGGVGALLVPWESRFRAAALNQPSFGFHTFRLAHPCWGSGESVRRVYEVAPVIRDTLHYFDAAFAARRIRVPVAAGVCAFDPAVPPPGQFAVANSIPPEFRSLSLFSFGHCDFSYPGMDEESRRYEQAIAGLFDSVKA